MAEQHIVCFYTVFYLGAVLLKGAVCPSFRVPALATKFGEKIPFRMYLTSSIFWHKCKS